MIINEQGGGWSPVRPDDYSKSTYNTKIGSDGKKYYKPKKVASTNTNNTNVSNRIPDLSEYEGSYTAKNQKVIVYGDNGVLNVTIPMKLGDFRDTLTPVPGSPDKFQTPKGKYIVVFKRDASNDITGASITGSGFSVDAVKSDNKTNSQTTNTQSNNNQTTNTSVTPNNSTSSVGPNGFPLCVDDRNTQADFWILSVSDGREHIPIAFSDTQQGAFDIENTKYKNSRYHDHVVNKQTCLYEPINCDYFSMGSGPQGCKVVFLKNGRFISDAAIIAGRYECDTVHGGVKLLDGLRGDVFLNEDVVKKLVRENLNKLLK